MKPGIHRSSISASGMGFTLVEIMVAMGLSVLLVAMLVSIIVYTARSFYMMGNYVILDSKSRNAVDVLGREIRDSSKLLGFSMNNPPYLKLTNATTPKIVYISYYPDNGTLMMTNIQNGTTTVQMLLTNCDNWSFSLYNRAPEISASDITFNTAADTANCKIINMSWKCSRTVTGSKLNTETVQTAEIILRNKTIE